MNLIEFYLKYNKEEYEKKFHKSYDDLTNDVNNILKQLPFNELIKLYFEYASVNKLKKYYVNNFLNLIYDNLVEKILSEELIDIIDIYAELFDKIIKLEFGIQSSKNIIKIRSYNIKNSSFLNLQSKNLHMSIEKFIDKYEAELSDFETNVDIQIKLFNYLNKLQIFIFDFLDQKIKVLSNQEADELIQNLNLRIEELSNIIMKKYKLLNNQTAFNIASRMNELTSYNLRSEDLKNKLSIYQDYQLLLIQQIQNSKKIN